MKRERTKKRTIKRCVAWLLLVVMGINCFGGQLQPGFAKVHATTYEDMTVNSATTLSKDIEVGNLTINQALHLNGYNLTVHGNVYVNGNLYMESGTLSVAGDYRETNNAMLWMESYNDYIHINGDYIYANRYMQSQRREKGTFELQGDIHGEDGSFCETSCEFGKNVKVILSGEETQTIDISTDSKMLINQLVINNTSEEGVLSKHMLMTEQITDDENKLHFMCEGEKGFVLTEDMEVEEDFCLTHGTLDLAGHTMTVKGNFSHAGGTLVFHGGSLIIEGDYAQQLTYEEHESYITDYSSGTLCMDTEADYLQIQGDWIVGGIRTTKEHLVAGTIELKGSLYMSEGIAPALLETSDKHILKITGNSTQVIRLGERYVGDYIRLAHLVIAQPESGSVQWTTPIVIKGSVSHKSTNINGDTRLEGGVIRSSHIYGNVEVMSGTPFVSDVVIHGNVTANTNLQGVGAASLLQVEQDLIINSNCKVTNMTLKVMGDVTGNGSSLSCGEDVTVHLMGTTTQNLSVSHKDSLFTNVVVDNPAGVMVQDNITVINVTCNQGVLSYASGGVHGFTLEEDMEYEGDLIIKGGSLKLNGHSLHVKGNLTVAGGYLTMTNETDYLLVDGNFDMTSNSSHSEKLTAGVLEIKGDFKQSGSGTSFAATDAHTTVFSGDVTQTVTFSDVSNSGVANVEFRNAAGVVASSTLPVNGLVVQSGPFQGVLGIKEHTVFDNNQFQGDVLVFRNITLSSDLEIEGNLTVGNSYKLYMAGNTLSIHGDVVLDNYGKIYVQKGHLTCDSLTDGYYYGCVVMEYAEDMLTIFHDMNIRSNYDMNNGHIKVGRDITFHNSCSATMGANAVLELNGTKKQTITMDQDKHSFGKLVFNNTSEEGVYIANDLKYTEIENETNTKVTFANGGILGYTLTQDETVEGDLTLSGGVLDLKGYNLTITGNFHHKGGEILLKNGTLIIQGDYNQECGISTDVGTLRVEGNWNVAGDVKGASTVFQIKKNLVQNASSYISFSNGCTLHLTGTEKQLITSRWGNINMTHLIIDNPAGMQLAGVDYSYIYGTIRTNGYPVEGRLMSYATVLDDTLCANIYFCGEHILSQDMYIKGNVELGGLKLNGYHLTVDGNCTLNEVGSSGTVEQPNGILEVKGNINSGTYVQYRGTGTNQVILSGEKKQTIAANNYKWSFKQLVIKNTSDEGVYSEELLNVETIVDENGKLSFPYDGVMGYTLSKDTVIQGDLNLLGGTMDLNGYKLTVMGNLTQRNGALLVNSGRLEVEGDYTLGNPNGSNQYQRNLAILSMQNAEDTVLIKGDFVFAPYVSHNTYLTSGVMELKGNLQCYYMDSSHRLGKEFTLQFSGNDKQTINIRKNYESYFRFGTLALENTSAEGVEVVNGLYVANSLHGGEQLHGVAGSHLYWDNGEALTMQQFDGNLTIYSGTRLQQDIRIGGTLTIGNALDINGKHLIANTIKLNNTLTLSGGIVQVKQNLTCGTNSSDYPNITMEHADDVLQVTGDFTAKKGRLNLIDGNLEIKGNVDMGGVTVTTGEHHITTLSGKITSKGTTYIQEITVGEGLTFQELVLTKPRNYYVFNREVEGMCKVLKEEILDTIPPSAPTGLSATNISFQKATISWQASTDDYGIAGYDLYRNDKKIMSLSGTTYVDKNLTPGTTYTYYVIAKDSVMNTSAASDTVTVTTLEDTEAPRVPEQPELSERMATALRLCWSEAADNVKTVGYRIYRNGEEIGTTNHTEYLDTGLDINSPYSYQITAYDAKGNESELSEEIEFYTQTVTIQEMRPANYGELSGEQVDLQLVFQNAGSSTGYQVYMAYREKGQEEYTTLVSKTVGEHTAYRKEIVVSGLLDTTTLTGEEVEVLVRITDAGGYITEETYTYYVDKTAPSVMEEVGVEVKDGVAVISYAKGTEVDIAGYYIYRQEEGKEIELLTDITEAGKTYYYDKTIEDGITYTYYVSAYDKDGHVGEKSEAITVTGTEDESAPVIESVEPIEGIIHGNTTITIRARDNKALDKAVIAVYDEVTNDYMPLSECTFHNGTATYEFDTTAYTDEVTLQITVTDTSGNENEEEYIKTYPVDNQGPEQIENLTAQVIATNVILHWDAPADDDFSHFSLEEQNEDGTWEEIATTTTITGYALEGLAPLSTHTYRVKGIDVRGNVGAASDALTVEIAEDTIVPHIINITPNGGYYSNVIPLEVKVYDNHKIATVHVESSVDQETWTNVTSVDLSKPLQEYTLRYDYNLDSIEEGELYIRAYAVDVTGNVGDVSQIVIQYVIDKTAPSAVGNLTASGDTGSIHLTWNEPIDNDIAGYSIYRSLEGLNRYTCIAEGITTLDYYDRSAAFDTSYSYKIYAIDNAGNISEASNVAVAQRMPDDEAPGVYSLIPENESYISGTCELSAYVADNDRIASVEFALKEEVADSTKMVIGTVTSDISSGTVTCHMDTTVYTNGTYQLQVTAKDASGNTSAAYTSTCHISNIDLPAPNLFATAGNWCSNVNYSGTKDTSYILYKKKLEDESFSVVTSGTGSLMYKDLDVHPSYTYQYQLVIQDQAGNEAESAVQYVKPIAIDDRAPEVVLQADTSVIAGYEVAFNGLSSTDNDKIATYEWDFGDKTDLQYGPMPIHTYKKAGDYYVTLTVTDNSGNSDYETVKITVLPKSVSGKANVKVTNQAGTPLSGVSVYVNTSNEKNDVSYTNDAGLTTVMQKPGTYRVALYKPGYVATEVEVEVEMHGEKDYTFVLPYGDTMTADFEVRQLTFEEIVAAGIDVNAPENQHVLTARAKLHFMPASRPLVMTIPLLPAKSVLFKETKKHVNTGGPGEGNKPGSGNVPGTDKEEKKAEYSDDLYYQICITSSISWLKDMYEATLLVYNNANSQTIVARDLEATIALPTGISLAGTKTGQSFSQNMPDIRGGESEFVTWYIRGDAPGEYQLNASLNGVLQPFAADFAANFTSDTFVVTAGDGLELIFQPEDRAEKDEPYYIHVVLKNTGDKEFYNVKTSFGTKFNNSKTFATTAKGNKKLPVMSAGDTVVVECLKPGESISGTYTRYLPIEGEKFRDYMELADYECEVLSGENLGVKVGVSPVGSHVAVPGITYQFLPPEKEEVDPVNVSTGAYTDSFTALSVQGVNPISANLQYDSNAVLEVGEFGYGWTHNYEARLLDMEDGTVRYYVSPTGYYTFLMEDFEKAEYKIDEKGYYYLDMSEIPMKQNFKCLNENEAGYVLKRKDNGTFTLTDDADTVLSFNKKGNLVKITNKDGKQVSIERGSDMFVVEDVVSERTLTYYLNDDKMVERVEDHTGREVFFYYDENQCLKQFTNAMGQHTYYTYDENHRILTVTDDSGNTYVKNEYKEFDSIINVTGKAVRVVSQKDGLGNITKFAYKENEQTGSLTTTVTTRSGAIKKTITDAYGNVTCSVNEAGDETLTTYDTEGNQTAVHNANGYSVVYGYDSSGNMTTIENSLMDDTKAETVMTYDGEGNMLTMENCNGESMACTYDSESGLIETVRDQNGNVTKYSYNNRGQITKEQDANERTVEYSYNDEGDLASVKDKNGNITTYTYNDLGLVETTTIKAGNEEYTTTTYYDDMGRTDYSIDTEGGVTSYEYDHAGNVISRTDPAGAMTVYQYDDNYQLIKETTYPSEKEGAKATSTTDYTYTKEGLLATVTDGISGTKITNSYDAVGNKIKEIEENKAGKKLSEIHYEYDKAGNVTKQTQVNLGEKIEKLEDESLDSSGESTDKENLTVTSKYYPNGKLNYVIDTAGKKTTYSYDKSWRVSSIVSDTEPTVTYTYDPAGRVLSEMVGEEGKLNQKVSYTYDIYGNVATATDAKGSITTYRYDNNGNLIETEDATGRVFYNKYDALNRVVESGIRKPDGTVEDNIPLTKTQYRIGDHSITETDAVHGGSITTYYDEAGRAYKTKDDQGTVLSETIYDSEGRVLQTVDANGLVSENVYNDFMQIATVKTGAKGSKNADGTYQLTEEIRETDYSYDELGRTTKVVEGEGEEETVSSVVFDGLGRIQSLRDPNQNASKEPKNTYTYEYTKEGLLSKETNAIGNVTEYHYNANLLLERVKDSANEETSYEYDSLNRLTSVKDGLGTITYTYDANGNITDVKETKNLLENLVNTGSTIHREFDKLNRITSYTDYQGRTVKYGYDNLGNLKTLTYPGGEIVTYTYNGDGSIATMTSNSGGTIYTWQYTYDRYGRLKTITRPDGTVENRFYDEAGNLEHQEDVNKDGTKVQENHYTYNVFGEVIEKQTLQDGDLSTLEVVKITYDDANRLESYNGKAVTYDAKGNMTYGPVDGVMQDLTYDCRNRLISAGGVTYTYDAENTRIATIENGKTTEYVTDTGGSLSKLLTAYEADGSTTTYFYGAEGLSGQYNSKTKEGLFYHFDNIGSTTAITNALGIAVYNFAYGTYGELLSTVEKSIRFLYNGAYGVVTDSNGLYYMRARYYNPDIKRFINQDIKVGDIGNSQSLNRYAYCEGNPISLIDPFGLSPQQSQEQTETSKYQTWHNILGIAGFFWDGFDLINGALYVLEGKPLEAALSFACGIPAIGNFIAGVAKTAKLAKTLSVANKIQDVCQAVGKLGNTASMMKASYDTWIESQKYENPAERIGYLVTTAAAGYILGKAGSWAAGKVKGAISKVMPRVKTTLQEAGKSLYTKIKSFGGSLGGSFGRGKRNRGYLNLGGSKGGSNPKQIINNRFPNEPQAGKRFDFSIQDGKIHLNNGINEVDFVIDLDGNLHLGRGHSYLANGANVQAAGTMKFNSQGYVRRITNASGHYTPSVQQASMFPELLNDVGLRTKNAWLEVGDYYITPSGLVDLNKTKYYSQKLR